MSDATLGPTIVVDGPAPPAIRTAGLLALVLLAAGTVAGLGRYGPGVQSAAVVALAVGIPTLLAFLARPYLGLQAYLLVLPLLPAGSPDALVNAGEVLTAGVVTLGVATSWTRRERILAAMEDLRPILWPIGALGLVSVASLIANGVVSIPDTLSALFKILAFGLIAVLVFIHADTPRRALGLLLALLAGAFAEALYSLGAFALGLDYYASYGYNRARGTFSTWNHLGGFMALLSVPTLAYALYTRRTFARGLLWFAFAAEIVTLLLSLTLGSVLGLVVGGLVAGVFIFHFPVRRMLGGALAFGTVFVAVYLFNPLLQEKIGRLGERVLDRLITYAVGVSMLQDNFWLGFGSQNRVVEALFLPFQGYTYTRFGESSVVPHASVLSIGVEKGIFGVLFFVLLIVGVVRVLLRQRERFRGRTENLLFQGVVVGLFAFLVQDMTNNLLLHARLGILFFSLLAVIVALGRHLAESGAEPTGA